VMIVFKYLPVQLEIDERLSLSPLSKTLHFH